MTQDKNTTAENARRRENEFTDAALDAQLDTFFLFEPATGKAVRWNRSFRDISGYSDEEIASMPAPDTYYSPEDLERAGTFIERILEEGAGTIELELVCKNGCKVPTEYRVSVITGEQGEPQYIISIGRDISERKRIEEARRESEERLRFLSDATLEGIVVTERGRVLDVNKALPEILGCATEDLVDKEVMQFVAPEDRDLVMDKIRSGYGGVYEHKALRKDGSTIDVEVRGHEISYMGRQARVTLIRDITERKKAEETLLAVAKGVSSSIGESFFQDLVVHLARALGADLALVAMLKGDDRKRAQTVAVCADGEIVENFEYDLNDTPCENVISEKACVYPVGVAQEFPRDLMLQKRGIEGYAGIPLKEPAGRVIGLMVVLYRQPIKDHDLVVNTLDIFGVRVATELERSRMEELRLRLETAIEQAEEVVVITDAQAEIQYVNPAFHRLTGYTRDETVGQNPSMLKSGQHDEVFYRQMWATLSQGDVWRGRLINKNKDGSLFEEEATISPVRDGNGKITNYVAVKRDVTRETELEDQLRQAQKMEAIGTLAGGIAHDFNNLLQAMLGYLQLAQSEVSGDSRAFEFLQEVAGAGERATDLVRQILSFSRQSQKERQPVRVQLVVREALKLLRASLPSTIEVRQSIDSDCGTVLADPTEVHQVLMNLCTNAYHSMRDQGGGLEITLDEVDLEAEQAARIPSLRAGRHVRLTVRDTGHGMDKATAERVFDPYFTTKMADEGTGLGLATVLGIVKRSGGAITVGSELGEGTTFEVFLPVAQHMAAFKREAVTDVALPIGTERVLFVDDEAAVADLGRKGLQLLGYSVEMHTSSHEALEAFRNAPESFDVVITDQTMPHITGIELAQEILRIRPDTPVILCTGFSELVDEATAKASGILEYVHKPVLPNELAKAIRLVQDSEQE
jgi:PAS domain S-box-containing protein